MFRLCKGSPGFIKNCKFFKFYSFFNVQFFIADFVLKAPVKGAEDPYDPNNFDEYYSDEYGGYGNPAGGGGMRGGNMNQRGPPGPGRFQGGGGGGPMNNRGM